MNFEFRFNCGKMTLIKESYKIENAIIGLKRVPKVESSIIGLLI